MFDRTIHTFVDIPAVYNCLDVLGNSRIGTFMENGKKLESETLGDIPIPFLSISVTRSASVSSAGLVVAPSRSSQTEGINSSPS